MNWMQCQTCRATVSTNCTGVCLGCQRGFLHHPQEDHFIEKKRSSKKDSEQKKLEKLQERQKEIEKELAHADEKPIPKSLDACEQTKDGKEVGKGNTKKRKAPKKSKKED